MNADRVSKVQRMKKTLRISLILSILLHVTVTFFLIRLERKPHFDNKPLDITLIDADQVNKDKKLDESKQIVDQSEKSINEDLADDAKYLSRNNQKVKEETRAVNHGRFNNDAQQAVAEKAKVQQEEVIEKPKTKISQAQKNLEEKKTQPAPWEVENQKTASGLPVLEALKPKFDWNKMAGQNLKKTVTDPGNPSATDDYIKDVKTGAQTMLNTREFIYFSYYNRIKSQLQQYWEPKIKAKVMKMFQQGRQLASDQDRITRLRITLNDKGVLVGVAVLNDSGVQDLDEAAIEAFRAAAPFPNPPKGIVEADGTIKIDWSFILEARDMPVFQFKAARADSL